MNRLARIVLLVGLMVAGVALLLMLGKERPDMSDRSSAPAGSQRVGRSALSHGGPGAGALPAHSEGLSADGGTGPSKQSSSATAR